MISSTQKPINETNIASTIAIIEPQQIIQTTKHRKLYHTSKAIIKQNKHIIQIKTLRVTHWKLILSTECLQTGQALEVLNQRSISLT